LMNDSLGVAAARRKGADRSSAPARSFIGRP
jgi:hypothetical protein